jgi:hypothetical protein
MYSIYKYLLKEYLEFLNRLYDITWFGAVKCSKPGYTSIICSKIWNILYNLIFTTKYNDSSILITIISCDYLNLSLANQYVGDVTIPTQAIEYNQNVLVIKERYACICIICVPNMLLYTKSCLVLLSFENIFYLGYFVIIFYTCDFYKKTRFCCRNCCVY